MKNNNLPKLDLNITNKCNFRCVHCAFDSGVINMSELSVKELKKILIDTKKLGGKRFDITGGEPLIRKDVNKIIMLGKKLGYKIELVTNASLLTKQKLRYFKKLGLDATAISLDGSNSKIYNKIRCKNKKIFQKIIKNIKLSKKLGFYTKINTTVLQSNYRDIPNIIKLAIKLKIDEVGLYYFTPIGRGARTKEFSVEPVKWLKFIRNKLKKFLDSKLKISLETLLIEKKFYKKEFGCIANNEKSHLQILPNGNTYPCAILASYNKPVANLKNKSIKYVWKNKKLWNKYWQNLSNIFNEHGGCCVDFSNFKIKNYSKKYSFVCPLRKFKLKEFPGI